MSTSTIFGVVGAGIGFFFGGVFGAQVGFLAGSLLGALVDPPKIEGPKRSDLRLQRSEYGWTIPWVYGRWRCAPNIIDQTDLIPHKKTEGGKSGPEIETETYTFSCQAYICQRPTAGFIEVLRLFANGRQIWDSSSGEDPPFILYDGNEDQLPDPTFEAINGIGNEPGYRGVVRAVFVDISATEFGDLIPQYEFEINTKVGVFPWRVSHFTTFPTTIAGNPKRTYSYANGIITIGAYCNDGRYYEEQFDLDGNAIAGTYYDAALVGGAGGALAGIDGITGGSNGSFGTGWYYKENFVGPLFGTYANDGQLAYYNGFIFGTGRDGVNIGLSKWPAPGGVITAASGIPDAEIELEAPAANFSDWILGRTNRENVYVWDNQVEILYEYDFDLVSGVIRQWDLSAQNAVQQIINGAGFTVYENSAGDLILACDRGNVGGKNAGAFYLNDDLTSTFIDKVDEIDGFVGDVGLLGRSGYALVADGVISLIPPPVAEILGDIVEDLNNKSPLRGLLTRTELDEDEVIGYAVGQVMTVRNAIEPLRQGWPFDIVEIDYGAVAKRRGATDSVITIPDSDLDARVFGEAPGDLLRLVRDREQSTPRLLKIKYNDIDLDYQTGTQNSPLLTSLSEQDVTIDLPIVDTATLAIGKAWTLLIAEVIEREHFEWSTTSKYGWLSQCDVVTIQGRVIRITDYTLTPQGVIKWKGVLHRPSIYEQTAPGAGAVGWQPQSTGGLAVGTELVLLDIPILSQHDAPFGFYAAMGPLRDGRWPGATLYKSLDDGVTWEPIASSNLPSVIGLTADSPDSPIVPGTLDPYLLGDVVDESSLFVRVTDDDAELLSATASGFANGANLCAISRGYSAGSPSTLQWELANFRDVVQLAPKSFVLTGWLRGRKGTLTTDHDVGDRFVLLPVTNVDAPESELNHSYKYRAVTFGTASADAVVQDFINTGKSADEFFDTESGHTPTPPDVETDPTYTFIQTDNGKLKSFNNAAGVTADFDPNLKLGWWCFVENIGVGDLVLDAGAGTIDEGASTLTIPTDQGVAITSDGDGNFYTMRGMGGGSGSPSGGSGIETQDDGSTVEAAATILNAVAPLSAAAVAGATDLTHDASGATPGSYGDGFNIPVVTVDTFGHVTVASTIAVGAVTPATGGDVWRQLLIRVAEPGNSTTMNQIGFGFGAAGGGLSTASTSSYLESRRYVRIDTSALVNSSIFLNATQLSYWQGNGAGLGGYRIEFEFGIQASSAELRLAVGLFGTVSNVSIATDPVNQTNAIFIGCDQADTALQIMHNDGSGTCTKVALSSNFPKTVGACYRLTLTQVPNTASVDWRVDRLDSAFTDSNTISTNMPSNTTFLNPEFAISTGSVLTTALRLAIYRAYSEQPY